VSESPVPAGAPSPARLTVLAGPSGVGKGSVVDLVKQRHPQVWVSVSVTTRHPRPGERDGQSYCFIDEPEFARMVTAGELLEHDAHLGASYGTPRAPVEQRLARGVPVLLEIDLYGARQVRRADPGALLVFLSPPSLSELQRRLAGRGTEHGERLERRLERARLEMAASQEFDHTVVNDDLEAAADRLVALMASSDVPARVRP